MMAAVSPTKRSKRKWFYLFEAEKNIERIFYFPYQLFKLYFVLEEVKNTVSFIRIF
jgi:hypothetical protein